MRLLNILVVDDSESIRLYMKRVLEPLNVEVTEAETGDQALKLIRENEYDLVFLDIEMPIMSGLEVTKRVRKQLGFMYTPIIVMTGLQQPELIQEAFDVGATDYITKPLSSIEIHARLKVRLENRRLDRELRQARIAAENANQAKSEFISRLAHELKTPLNAINGFAQLIQMTANDDEVEEQAGHIINAAKLQEELINEVTNLARIEAGIIDMELKQVDLATIIKEAFSLTTPMANKFNINLTRPRKADLSCNVTADDTRLKQVLLNLISNAIKYNKPNGEVTIEIKKSEHSPFVLIGVRDTGIGISSQKMSKLFEPFNRLGAENTNIEGVGIGLSITKKIVELMGGHIDVETEEGKGSVFWVEIPVATS
jgi:signal transduction histidine kinase